MRIGILVTGYVPEHMATEHGEYPEQFRDLYRAVDPSVEVEAVDILAGEMPTSPDACDAWVVTGSKHGVYDDLPWIEPLKNFLREARSAGVPLIGICFGHQLMAEAFGGRAEKSNKGWGCGVHDYSVEHRPAWLGENPQSFAMHAMHQDQVTAIPEDATRLAGSEFCEFAMLSYGNAEAPDAISIQPHPEFAEGYARGLVELRKGELIPDATADKALSTFGSPVDGEAFARWSLAYARLMDQRRKAA